MEMFMPDRIVLEVHKHFQARLDAEQTESGRRLPRLRRAANSGMIIKNGNLNHVRSRTTTSIHSDMYQSAFCRLLR